MTRESGRRERRGGFVDSTQSPRSSKVGESIAQSGATARLRHALRMSPQISWLFPFLQGTRLLPSRWRVSGPRVRSWIITAGGRRKAISEGLWSCIRWEYSDNDCWPCWSMRSTCGVQVAASFPEWVNAHVCGVMDTWAWIHMRPHGDVVRLPLIGRNLQQCTTL